jgi:hypothetical protein
MLLGGAVIGSVDDLSGVFYNPGALGYIEAPELLLSANVYGFETLTLQDGGGEGIDLTSSHFNLLPAMVAGAFRSTWLGRNKLAYSFLTRHRFSSRVQNLSSGSFDVLPDPGVETFAGGLNLEAEAKEFWAGVTWARPATDRVGFGVTTFLSIRNESGRNEILAQALTDSSDISVIYDVDTFRSTVYSLIWKAGIGIDLDPLTLGVAVTTPNLEIYGRGDATYNSTTVGVDRDGDNTPENAFETDVQKDVTANYKSTLSIGAGAAYATHRTRLNLSAEWFAAVDGYDALELDPFVSQTTGEVVERSLRQRRDDVFNVAVGIEHELAEKSVGYLGFRTNNSSFNPESDISATGMDVYHATGGAKVAIGRINWTVGVGYAWGSQKKTPVIDLDPDSGGGAVSPQGEVALDYTRWTFLIGFRVGL